MVAAEKEKTTRFVVEIGFFKQATAVFVSLKI